MKVFPHEGVYIGLVQVFHATPEETLEVQLAVSRDSLHFTRVGDRSLFLPVGPVGSWDRFNLSLANNEPLVAGMNCASTTPGACIGTVLTPVPTKARRRAASVSRASNDCFVALEALRTAGNRDEATHVEGRHPPLERKIRFRRDCR
jgi:hypothetical protein